MGHLSAFSHWLFLTSPGPLLENEGWTRFDWVGLGLTGPGLSAWSPAQAELSGLPELMLIAYFMLPIR